MLIHSVDKYGRLHVSSLDQRGNIFPRRNFFVFVFGRFLLYFISYNVSCLRIKRFLQIPLSSFYLRLGYPALLFIDTEVILFPKTSPLSLPSPDFGNPSSIEIDAVRGLVGGCDFNIYLSFKKLQAITLIKIRNDVISFHSS